MIQPSLTRIHSFDVVPSLPEPLKPLLDIAHNLWWSWHPEAIELFIRLDRSLWVQTHHNPVQMLGMLSQQTLDSFARDEGFLNMLSRAQANLERHMTRTSWLKQTKKENSDWTVAYFCAEFGLTDCLHIYSGGLGCLAGDHLKSAAEIGLPLIGVGLLYRRGYFEQYLNADGWQQERHPNLDFNNLPISRVVDGDGKQVIVEVTLPGRPVQIALWKVHVGRVTLYLLDTNLAANREEDRQITNQLYGGDMEHRIKQEIVLGIGGTRALKALGIRPDVCHLNEGHSAFLALERIGDLISEHDISFDEAREFAASSHVFTTHTPVPAGIDRFPTDMVTRYLKDYLPSLRLDLEGLLALGRENVFNTHEEFSMAVLAIRTSEWANGVSELHGHVSRDMWQNIWPDVPVNEIPITHVTNGVHARSWLSSDLMYMLDRYLGGRWQSRPVDHDVWRTIHEVPDEELWQVHQRRRHKLIIWARRRLRTQLEARGTSRDKVQEAVDALNPNAMTIGFARRFATYKRGNLILRDPERLTRLLNSTTQPIQFLIAGKAHPRDGGGKDLIRQIVHFSRESQAGHKIVFLENYDIHTARYLVQGCDLWLNTPRRGMEASGTSGMKAAMNGVLNCSILDGWWDEAFVNELGWSIGQREEYADPDMADELESQGLYDLLEHDIVPMFYDVDNQGLPREWVGRMKQCIATLAPFFNTNRMVQQYAENLYLPALRRARRLGANNLERSRIHAHQKQRLRAHWNEIRVEDVVVDAPEPVGVEDDITVKVRVALGQLRPEEVRVLAYYGPLDSDGRMSRCRPITLTLHGERDNGFAYQAVLETEHSGKHGVAIRVVPGGEDFEEVVIPGLTTWESPR